MLHTPHSALITVKIMTYLFFPIIFLSSFVKISASTPSVIIVGAGPAGIAAGARLLEHGYENLKILEAENRIGGRIYSVFFGDAYVDLGAEWCHGQKTVVYEKLKEYNILRPDESGTSIYHSSGKTISQEMADELMALMHAVHDPLLEGEGGGMILGHYLQERYNKTVHEKYRDEPEKLEVAKEAVDLYHHLVLSYDGAFNWSDVSATSDYRISGDQDLHWNGFGYKTVLEVLMRKFPDPSNQLPFDGKIFLNKEVVGVTWNSSRVAVECSDGTVFEADHVIFTPSVGVLKESHAKIFSPPLPKRKIEAINRIGIGAVMKVFMHFEDKWWGENFTGFHLLWTEADKYNVCKQFPKGPVKDGRSWLNDILAFYYAEYNPNVITAWLTGEMVPEIEQLSDETLLEGLQFVLKKFVGDKYNITEPDSIKRSSWYTNRHFRGTWSFQTLESSRGNVSAEMELSRPLLNIENRPVVMFAGEASHPYFYSTVHGAIETGFREADRILQK